MAAPAPPRIVIDGEDGSTLALATIDIIDPDVVRASLHVTPGTSHPAPAPASSTPSSTTRRSARGAVCRSTLPLGDTEILDRLRERGRAHVVPRRRARRRLVEADLPVA